MDAKNTFQLILPLEKRHLDVFGHVNNTAYFELLEEARWDIARQNHFSKEEVVEKLQGPIVLEIVARFRKEIRGDSKVTITTRCIGMTTRIVDLEQHIKNEQNEVCCEATVKLALFDLNERKLLFLTPEFRKAFGVDNE